jgi:hypothetical protein
MSLDIFAQNCIERGIRKMQLFHGLEGGQLHFVRLFISSRRVFIGWDERQTHRN